MLYLLDTNAISDLMHLRSANLVHRVERAKGVNTLTVSVISVAEIRYGVQKRGNPSRLVQALESLLFGFPTLPWMDQTAKVYSYLRAHNEQRGINLSTMDMLIAAHAVEHNAVLVTRDAAFAKLEGLRTEDWSVSDRGQ